MSTPFQLLALDHVVLKVADMDRSIRFYGEVLGAHEVRRVESIGLVQLRAGASLIDLVPRGGEEGGGDEDGGQRVVERTVHRGAPLRCGPCGPHPARHV